MFACSVQVECNSLEYSRLCRYSKTVLRHFEWCFVSFEPCFDWKWIHIFYGYVCWTISSWRHLWLGMTWKMNRNSMWIHCHDEFRFHETFPFYRWSYALPMLFNSNFLPKIDVQPRLWTWCVSIELKLQESPFQNQVLEVELWRWIIPGVWGGIGGHVWWIF